MVSVRFVFSLLEQLLWGQRPRFSLFLAAVLAGQRPHFSPMLFLCGQFRSRMELVLACNWVAVSQEAALLLLFAQAVVGCFWFAGSTATAFCPGSCGVLF